VSRQEAGRAGGGRIPGRAEELVRTGLRGPEQSGSSEQGRDLAVSRRRQPETRTRLALDASRSDRSGQKTASDDRAGSDRRGRSSFRRRAEELGEDRPERTRQRLWPGAAAKKTGASDGGGCERS
jgi:hypothetical protein